MCLEEVVLKLKLRNMSGLLISGEGGMGGGGLGSVHPLNSTPGLVVPTEPGGLRAGCFQMECPQTSSVLQTGALNIGLPDEIWDTPLNWNFKEPTINF